MSIFGLPSILSRWADKIFLLIQKVSLALLILVGLVIIIVSFIASIYVSGINTIAIKQSFGLGIAGLGCGIGMSILSLVIPKLGGIRVEQERASIVAEALRQAQTKQALARLEKLEIEREKIQDEVERQRNRRVDVNSVQPALELGLAKLEIRGTDFIIKKIQEKASLMDIWRGDKKDFVGAIQYKFSASFGVDLGKLRFTDLPNGQLQISGIYSEFQGKKNDEFITALAEIRHHRTKDQVLSNISGESIDILSSHQIKKGGTSDFVSHMEEHLKELQSRINQGMEFKHLDDYVVKMAKEVLRVMLMPIGKEITYADTANEIGKPLLDYLKYNNQLVDERLQLLTEQKRALILTPSVIPNAALNA